MLLGVGTRSAHVGRVEGTYGACRSVLARDLAEYLAGQLTAPLVELPATLDPVSRSVGRSGHCAQRRAIRVGGRHGNDVPTSCGQTRDHARGARSGGTCGPTGRSRRGIAGDRRSAGIDWRTPLDRGRAVGHEDVDLLGGHRHVGTEIMATVPTEMLVAHKVFPSGLTVRAMGWSWLPPTLMGAPTKAPVVGSIWEMVPGPSLTTQTAGPSAVKATGLTATPLG